MSKLDETDSKFFKVKCAKCKNEQIIFEKPSSKVSCLVCNEPIAQPTGGKLKSNAQVIEVLK